MGEVKLCRTCPHDGEQDGGCVGCHAYSNWESDLPAAYRAELVAERERSAALEAEVAKLKFFREEITGQTLRAKEGECGFPDEEHCNCRPILLRAIEELKAEVAQVGEERDGSVKLREEALAMIGLFDGKLATAQERITALRALAEDTGHAEAANAIAVLVDQREDYTREIVHMRDDMVSAKNRASYAETDLASVRKSAETLLEEMDRTKRSLGHLMIHLPWGSIDAGVAHSAHERAVAATEAYRKANPKIGA